MYNRLVAIWRSGTVADWCWRFATGGSLLIILLRIRYLLLGALHNSHFFNGPPIDGAFQLLDPLRRIAEGQTMGRDFLFFHGPGLPFLHYPLYWLFGSNLHASILSQWIMSLIFFVASITWLLYVATKRWKVVAIGLASCLVFPFLWDLISPASTLLGIRS